MQFLVRYFKSLSDLQKIKYIILFALLIRLFGITNPPLEISHNWRQSLSTMTARNFLETDHNIFYPRIDFGGDMTGITGMEFPIFSYLIYFVSLLFGYTHWYGRLINLIISSIGLLYFYKLTNRYFSKETSFYGTIVLIFSLWFPFARKIMPDTFSLSFIIIAIYTCSLYIKNPQKWHLVPVYFLLVLLGISSKITATYLLSIILLIVMVDYKKLSLGIIISATTIVAVSIMFTWYFYWSPKLSAEHENWHFFMGTDLKNGILQLVVNWKDTLSKFYDNSLKYIGFLFFMVGVTYSIIKKQKKIMLVFGVGFLSFLSVMVVAGFNFPHHDYYVLPFVPFMALVSGYGISKLKWHKLKPIIVFFIIAECTINYHYDFRNNKNLELLSLENHLDNFTNRNDLIAINCAPYPTPMYFAHRKGLIEYNHNLLKQEYVKVLKTRGIKFIVVLRHNFGQDIEMNLDLEFENKDFKIYKL